MGHDAPHVRVALQEALTVIAPTRFAHRLRALLGATAVGAALVMALAPAAAAAAPEVYLRNGNSYSPGYYHCGPASGGFDIDGDWAITGRLTVFVTNDGVPVRDIEEIHFDGRWVNPSNGKWTSDKGGLTFFDTLNPDGSFDTTFLNMHRAGSYLHVAGRVNFQDGSFRGHGESDAQVAALCAALSD